MKYELRTGMYFINDEDFLGFDLRINQCNVILDNT